MCEISTAVLFVVGHARTWGSLVFAVYVFESLLIKENYQE